MRLFKYVNRVWLKDQNLTGVTKAFFEVGGAGGQGRQWVCTRGNVPDCTSSQINTLLCQIGLAEPCEDFGAGRIPQPDCGGKVRSGRSERLPDMNRDRAASRKPVARAQDRAGAANGDWNDRDSRLAGDLEGSQVKAEQSRHARERTLREPGETSTRADFIERVKDIGNASRRIRPADEHGLKAAQE
jgi:hypothetical protein